jgi:hypothetical protein
MFTALDEDALTAGCTRENLRKPAFCFSHIYSFHRTAFVVIMTNSQF